MRQERDRTASGNKIDIDSDDVIIAAVDHKIFKINVFCLLLDADLYSNKALRWFPKCWTILSECFHSALEERREHEAWFSNNKSGNSGSPSSFSYPQITGLWVRCWRGATLHHHISLSSSLRHSPRCFTAVPVTVYCGYDWQGGGSDLCRRCNYG